LTITVMSCIYLFMHIFNTSSVIQAIFSRMAGWLVNIELKRTFNEAAVA